MRLVISTAGQETCVDPDTLTRATQETHSSRASPVQVNDADEVPHEIREALSARLTTGARELHRLKIGLAELVLRVAEPGASGQLEVARRFVEAGATEAELADARQDCWAHIGSLACYCTPTDSLASQAILCCLEADESQHTPASLSEQAVRVLRCGAPAERVLLALAT